MKKGITLIAMTVITIALHCQHTVSKQWDARFGGTKEEFLYSVSQTSDGAFVVCGSSLSDSSGNKTQNNWDRSFNSDDCWIVKIDAQGHYLWDKRYGGIGEEESYSICSSNDGGCIIGSFSDSPIGGDKSQVSKGGFDYWVVKLNADGTKQWDKCYGGSGQDVLYSIKQTKDGGYILAGNSSSNISGDKTEPNRDPGSPTYDYWVVKIDSLGNKQWDKRFGTSEDENCHDVIQTPDGGYLIGGSSPSYHANGDKSQPNFAQVTQNYWVVKVDSVGNKQWDKVFGGTAGEYLGSVLNTTDGNYMLGGTSDDGVSGNKTSSSCGYWLVKIDTAGNKLGDWSYVSSSGVCGEKFRSMSNTPDGGFLLTGYGVMVLTIKVDSQMNKVWDKQSLTVPYSNETDYSGGALSFGAGCYMVGVTTAASIGGDKTQAAWDSSYDYWVVTYCDTTFTGITETAGDIHFSIYPNPTAGEISVTLEKENLKEAAFTFTNTSGQLIYQSEETNLARSYTKMLDIHALPAGVYVLEIVVDGQRISRRVVKE